MPLLIWSHYFQIGQTFRDLLQSKSKSSPRKSIQESQDTPQRVLSCDRGLLFKTAKKYQGLLRKTSAPPSLPSNDGEDQAVGLYNFEETLSFLALSKQEPFLPESDTSFGNLGYDNLLRQLPSLCPTFTQKRLGQASSNASNQKPNFLASLPPPMDKVSAVGRAQSDSILVQPSHKSPMMKGADVGIARQYSLELKQNNHNGPHEATNALERLLEPQGIDSATRALNELLESRKFDDTIEPLPMEQAALKVDLGAGNMDVTPVVAPRQESTIYRPHRSFDDAMDDLLRRFG